MNEPISFKHLTSVKIVIPQEGNCALRARCDKQLNLAAFNAPHHAAHIQGSICNIAW